MNKIKLLAITAFLVCTIRAEATPPALTNVSATIQDSSTQVWSNATWTTTFIPPFGNPAVPNNNGNPITANQSGVADGAGHFTVTLDDNNVVAPAGSKWKFTICPNATVSSCTEIQLIITGPTMDVSAAINTSIVPPVVGAQPNIARAYNDSEVSGSFAVLYINSIDNTLRQCQIIFCNGTGWVVITVPVNNPVFTGTLTVPCVKFDTTIPTDDTTLCGQPLVGHINILLPAVSGTLALLNSPVFTGDPQAPTPPTPDNDNSIATTAFVKNQGYVTASTAPVTSVFGRTGAVVANSGDYSVGQVTGAAPLASPTFTGIPAAPTAAPGTNTTQIATTAFVTNAVAGSGSAILAHSVTTCTGCPITFGNSYTVIISHAITFPSSGCPCRVLASYVLYMTTGTSGADAAAVNEGGNVWAGANNNTTGSVGGGSTYGLSASGISPVTYANSSTHTFSVVSANSHGGNATANATVASDITVGPFVPSELELTVITSQ